jgi:hypothetical protein
MERILEAQSNSSSSDSGSHLSSLFTNDGENAIMSSLRKKRMSHPARDLIEEEQ